LDEEADVDMDAQTPPSPLGGGGEMDPDYEPENWYTWGEKIEQRISGVQTFATETTKYLDYLGDRVEETHELVEKNALENISRLEELEEAFASLAQKTQPAPLDIPALTQIVEEHLQVGLKKCRDLSVVSDEFFPFKVC